MTRALSRAKARPPRRREYVLRVDPGEARRRIQELVGERFQYEHRRGGGFAIGGHANPDQIDAGVVGTVMAVEAGSRLVLRSRRWGPRPRQLAWFAVISCVLVVVFLVELLLLGRIAWGAVSVFLASAAFTLGSWLLQSEHRQIADVLTAVERAIAAVRHEPETDPFRSRRALAERR